MSLTQEHEMTRLGYLGLIPFAAGATALLLSPWIIPQVSALAVHSVTLVYGAVIAAYLAGTGAGSLISTSKPSREPLLSGMSAALVAWFAAWPTVFGFSLGQAWRDLLLIGVLCFLLLRDLRAVRAGGMPSWYAPIRIRLTVFACMFLLLMMLRLLAMGFY